MKQALFGFCLLPLVCFTMAASASETPDDPSADGESQAEPFELSELIKRAVDRSAAEVIVQSNNDRTLALNGSHQHVYMARIGADGKMETYCASSEAAVRTFLFKRPANDD